MHRNKRRISSIKSKTTQSWRICNTGVKLLMIKKFKDHQQQQNQHHQECPVVVLTQSSNETKGVIEAANNKQQSAAAAAKNNTIKKIKIKKRKNTTSSSQQQQLQQQIKSPSISLLIGEGTKSEILIDANSTVGKSSVTSATTSTVLSPSSVSQSSHDLLSLKYATSTHSLVNKPGGSKSKTTSENNSNYSSNAALQSVDVSSEDKDALCDMIEKIQGDRLDNQRCELTTQDYSVSLKMMIFLFFFFISYHNEFRPLFFT